MGILGELNHMSKSGQVEQLYVFMNQHAAHEGNGHFSATSATPQIVGAERRRFNHDMEISIASNR